MSLNTKRVLAVASAVVVIALIGAVFGDSVGAALGIAAASGVVLLLVMHFRAQ
jgi:TctA family transporter